MSLTDRLRDGVARLLVGLLCAGLLASAAAAQSGASTAAENVAVDGVPRFELWERVADRAQEAISKATASSETFEILRRELVGWRLTFEGGQSTNRDRIQTLRGQIAALGDPPAEGGEEIPELSARRADLNRQLGAAEVPGRRSEEALTQVNGLVRELDALLRARQTDRILKLDPTPFNPVHWPVAAREVIALGEVIRNEVSGNFASPVRMQSFKDNLPLTLVLLVIGVVLVVRTLSWVERGLAALRTHYTESRAGVRVTAFAASAAGVVLPFLGIVAVLQALNQTELLGAAGAFLLDQVAWFVATVFGARWLAKQAFPRTYPPRPILALSAVHLKQARGYTTLLGAFVALDLLTRNVLGSMVMSSDWSDATSPVLRFPVITVAGLLLFRLGQVLSRVERVVPDDPTVVTEAPSSLITSFLSRGAMTAGLIGPVLAATGYVTAGGLLVFSSVMTLALIALVAVLQRLIRDIYAAIVGGDAVGSGLIPVLLGFALALGSVPILALIWGARPADLTDAWEYVATGFQIGDTRISLTDFLTFAVIFAIGYSATRLLQGSLRTQILPKTRLDTGGRNAAVAGTGYVGIFLAALIAITGAGIDLSSLAIVAGALSVGIGFGLQTIVSNFVSGIILLIERPISEGDWIEVGPTMGVVKGISVRSTRIETFDRTDVIVPNADLISGTVTNWTKGNLTGRLIIPVGVSYSSDTERVAEILREIVEDHPIVIINPPPAIIFMNFGADSFEFEIRAILRDVNFLLSARSEINHAIAKRFREEGIEIPFGQRDIWLRNPEQIAITPSDQQS